MNANIKKRKYQINGGISSIKLFTALFLILFLFYNLSAQSFFKSILKSKSDKTENEEGI